MRRIERFGKWILESTAGMIFVGFLAMSAVLAFVPAGSPTVKISAKEFFCSEAEPDGLGTRCVNYRRLR
jgi:hypothetical protein